MSGIENFLSFLGIAIFICQIVFSYLYYRWRKEDEECLRKMEALRVDLSANRELYRLARIEEYAERNGLVVEAVEKINDDATFLNLKPGRYHHIDV